MVDPQTSRFWQASLQSGLIDAQEVLKKVRGIAFTRFGTEDVVRHPLVQRIVNAYETRENRTARGAAKT